MITLAAPPLVPVDLQIAAVLLAGALARMRERRDAEWLAVLMGVGQEPAGDVRAGAKE